MGEPPVHPPPLPPPSLPKSNLPMLYYGLVVVGTAAIVLALYNLIIVKWCAEYPHGTHLGRTGELEPTSTRRFNKPNKFSMSSFKYKKEVGEEDDFECSVCLSVFEEGEEIRQLPNCKHCFHAPCIDMWLYSHLDCPLCRSAVEPPVLRWCSVTEQSENSREGLLDLDNLV
ncbi:RING-H2 finger protein ATL52 [Abeliophyllum distichum]|uniref:RING-H2 finger protein ATL52 n=1 Tax=Abeliophyllum distichum TaxID=126358 RepID=A0ABD1QV11_9LAMI